MDRCRVRQLKNLVIAQERSMFMVLKSETLSVGLM